MKTTHDQVLSILLDHFPGRVDFYTTSQGLPALRFLGINQRKIDHKDRLAEGIWFLGNKDYLSISLSDHYSRGKVTKISIGINLNTMEAGLRFNGHSDNGDMADVLQIVKLYETRVNNGRKLIVRQKVENWGNKYCKDYPGHFRHTLGRIISDWISFKNEVVMEGLYPETL